MLRGWALCGAGGEGDEEAKARSEVSGDSEDGRGSESDDDGESSGSSSSSGESPKEREAEVPSSSGFGLRSLLPSLRCPWAAAASRRAAELLPALGGGNRSGGASPGPTYSEAGLPEPMYIRNLHFTEPGGNPPPDGSPSAGVALQAALAISRYLLRANPTQYHLELTRLSDDAVLLRGLPDEGQILVWGAPSAEPEMSPEEIEELQGRLGIALVHPGLSRDEVDRLPTYTFTGRGSSSAKSCAICQESYAVGEDIRTLPCLHRFHKECVDRWLMSDAPAASTCPVCHWRVRV